MELKETGEYIAHHIKLAGRTDTLFSDDAVALIHEASRGLPRAVNNLATQSLIAAYATNKSLSATRAQPAPRSPRSQPNDRRADLPARAGHAATLRRSDRPIRGHRAAGAGGLAGATRQRGLPRAARRDRREDRPKH
jgi:hypothetical protein